MIARYLSCADDEAQEDETFESTICECTILDEDDSQGLLKTVLGFFARKRPEREGGLLHEEPNAGDNLEDPDADFAMLMSRHLVSLDNALRKR
ncbi:hypothetical protein B7494_g8543 [Chlorociboria aeruginascens]|nr:hypothetical protein B7494_g8543 [Chlorociboria aeruginascens]